jgi:hypothetical protein
MADVPVSVTDFEKAPISISGDGKSSWEVEMGGTLKLPLRVTWRSEFNGTSLKLKPYGTVFAGLKEVDLPIKATASEVLLDLAALKIPAGDHTLVFSGIGVDRHRPNQEELKTAEEEQKRAQNEAADLAKAAKLLAEKADAALPEEKEEAKKAAKTAAEKQKAAEVVLARMNSRLKGLTDAAAAKDMLDFFVTEPVLVSVKAAPPAPAPQVVPTPGSAAPVPTAQRTQ